MVFNRNRIWLPGFSVTSQSKLSYNHVAHRVAGHHRQNSPRQTDAVAACLFWPSPHQRTGDSGHWVIVPGGPQRRPGQGHKRPRPSSSPSSTSLPLSSAVTYARARAPGARPPPPAPPPPGPACPPDVRLHTPCPPPSPPGPPPARLSRSPPGQMFSDHQVRFSKSSRVADFVWALGPAALQASRRRRRPG